MIFFIGSIAVLLWVIIFFNWRLRRAYKNHDTPMEKLIREEREANSARRKEIDESLFFIADVSQLPVTDDGGDKQEKVLKRAARTMIRFTQPMTNLELKMTYGPSQLETIARYEENFHRYLEALIEWAENLHAYGRNHEAIRILMHTVELGSEYRKSYMLAADLFAAEGDEDALDALLSTAETHSFADEGVRRRIIGHIIQKRNEVNP